MSVSPDDLLKEGAVAMQQSRYPEAIVALETFCKGAIDRRSPPFFQAQRWLVQAYQKSGQDLHAIALCEQMLKSDILPVQQWAQTVLNYLLGETSPPPTRSTPAAAIPNPSPDPIAEASLSSCPSFLQPTALLTAETAAAQFAVGRKALQKRCYDDAIKAFEAFIQGTDSSYANYAWACTSLGKAYRGSDQLDKALALCQHLQESQQESLQSWAKDFLKTLNLEPLDNAELLSTSQEEVQTEDDGLSQPLSTLNQHSVSGQISSVQPVAPAQLTRRPQGKDLTPQILSALSHGSISLLGSLLVYLFFQDSALANLLALLRFAIPLGIFLNTQDALVKANAKEALNYIISSLLIVVVGVLGIVLLLLPLTLVLGPLIWLPMIAIGAYSLALTIWPIVGTVLCAQDDQRVFRYPDWLIWHLL